jgi:hypothetical protein
MVLEMMPHEDVPETVKYQMLQSLQILAQNFFRHVSSSEHNQYNTHFYEQPET